jgi:excisionase family DNA binding protein
MAENDLLNVPETAALLRLKTSTIRAWVCQRKIPYVKLGRLVRIRRSDIEALIAKSVVPPPTENLTETKQKGIVNSNADQTPQFFPQS